jgi:hypothetical protein
MQGGGLGLLSRAAKTLEQGNLFEGSLQLQR